MADEQNTQTTHTAPAAPENNAPAGGEAKPNPADEKKFSQAELDKILGERLERERKGQPSKEELESFRKWQDSQKSEAEKQAERDKDYTAAKQRITELEKELTAERVTAQVRKQAAALGADTAALDYIAKLADVSDVLDKDGKPDTDKITAAVTKVLSDIPALKAKAESSGGFVTVGSQGGGSQAKEQDFDDKLRRSFGLKPKG